MPELSDFDDYILQEADKYLKEVKENRGEATTNRQIGQRKRRLREALYKATSESSGNLQFTTTPESLKEAGIEAAIQQANIDDSVGEEIEKYGVPPGGMLIDDTNYEDELEMEDEVLYDHTLYPKNAEIFGDKDGFGDWLQNVYLQSRPLLKDMIDYQYWRLKDGSYNFGKKRNNIQRAKALKFLSWKLRERISKNGITPNSVTVSSTTTILNYDSGSHTLSKGRDN